MVEPIIITVPGPPVPKGRPRFSTVNGHGRAFTPGKTRLYEDLIRLAAGEVMAGSTPLDCALRVRIDAYLPIPKSMSKAKRAAAVAGEVRPTTKPDADNFAKCVDALNAIVWRDDSQIVQLAVAKHYSETPRLELTVAEWKR